jgi:hypothetical protein
MRAGGPTQCSAAFSTVVRRTRRAQCGTAADIFAKSGLETVGEIVDYEKTFLLCNVRGPEGLIVELAERLDGAPG